MKEITLTNEEYASLIESNRDMNEHIKKMNEEIAVKICLLRPSNARTRKKGYRK